MPESITNAEIQKRADAHNKKARMLGLPESIEVKDGRLVRLLPDKNGKAAVPEYISSITKFQKPIDYMEFKELCMHPGITDISDFAFNGIEIEKLVIRGDKARKAVFDVLSNSNEHVIFSVDLDYSIGVKELVSWMPLIYRSVTAGKGSYNRREDALFKFDADEVMHYLIESILGVDGKLKISIAAGVTGKVCTKCRLRKCSTMLKMFEASLEDSAVFKSYAYALDYILTEMQRAIALTEFAKDRDRIMQAFKEGYHETDLDEKEQANILVDAEPYVKFIEDLAHTEEIRNRILGLKGKSCTTYDYIRDTVFNLKIPII